MISAIDYWFSAKICQNVNDKVLIRQPKIPYTIVAGVVIRSTLPENALFGDYMKKSVNILKNSQINKQNAHNEKSSERVFLSRLVTPFSTGSHTLISPGPRLAHRW